MSSVEGQQGRNIFRYLAISLSRYLAISLSRYLAISLSRYLAKAMYKTVYDNAFTVIKLFELS